MLIEIIYIVGNFYFLIHLPKPATLVTMIIFDRFSKLKWKWVKFIPSSLVCMVLIILIEFLIVRNCGYHTLTLRDIAPFSSANAYPRPFFINPIYDMNEFNSESGGRIMIDALMLAFMVILETTMTQEVVNEYTNNEGNLDRQYIALGNFLIFFSSNKLIFIYFIRSWQYFHRFFRGKHGWSHAWNFND